MLQYLHRKGEYEAVGGFFRNQRMEQAESDSEEYKKKCKKEKQSYGGGSLDE